MAEKEQTLEKLFTQLEDVIREMEQGEVSLEEAFALYHNCLLYTSGIMKNF